MGAPRDAGRALAGRVVRPAGAALRRVSVLRITIPSAQLCRFKARLSVHFESHCSKACLTHLIPSTSALSGPASSSASRHSPSFSPWPVRRSRATARSRCRAEHPLAPTHHEATPVWGIEGLSSRPASQAPARGKVKACEALRLREATPTDAPINGASISVRSLTPRIEEAVDKARLPQAA